MAQRPRFRLIEGRQGREDGIRSRMLPSRQGAPALEFMEGRPDGAPIGPPLLFVHGAFGGAWMWREVFLPYLVKRGRHVAAFSLRAHGRSGGYESLREWRLSDYMDDLRRAHGEMPEPPVIVGHSLGGLLAQMLIGRMEMRGLVLAGSLPPEGMFFEGPRLAVTDPGIWFEALLASVAKARAPIASASYGVLFSEGVPAEQVERYASLMVPESPRALAEAHAPGPVFPAALFRLPTLVLRGTLDRLVLASSAWRTRLYHSAELGTAEGMGHFLQLDVGAERVAQEITDWIDRTIP